jgi:hypothetical protein
LGGVKFFSAKNSWSRTVKVKGFAQSAHVKVWSGIETPYEARQR